MYFQVSEEIQLVLKLPALTITVQQRRSTLELFVILNLRGYGFIVYNPTFNNISVLNLTPITNLLQ